jgi:lambda repressor-like predicted transcriptional regulator
MGGKGSGPRAVIRINGKTCAELSRETGLSPQVLRARKLAGWKVRDIVAKKPLAGMGITVEGKTLREIATEAGLPLPTVKWRYYRGYRTLQELTRPRYALRAEPKV